jgi:CheY-like chemotaxis protein
VDDDPLMRDVVEMSLGLDPEFVVMSVADGDSALAVVGAWAPDLVLCDVLMPGMDGPALLARLRETPATAKIPLFFMTARTKAGERERLMALGAAAVLAKPFLPIKLADTVRRHLNTIQLASAGFDFTQRLRADAAALAAFRGKTDDGSRVPEELQSIAHKLAGAAGVFDFPAISATASALEDAVIERREGRGGAGAVGVRLETLLECIERT